MEFDQVYKEDGTPKHVVMLVSNPCDPDYRVVKEAESLARIGYRVSVLCTWKPGLGIPTRAEINGVTYVRHEWNPVKIVGALLGGRSGYSEVPRVDRARHERLVDRFGRRK